MSGGPCYECTSSGSRKKGVAVRFGKQKFCPDSETVRGNDRGTEPDKVGPSDTVTNGSRTVLPWLFTKHELAHSRFHLFFRSLEGSEGARERRAGGREKKERKEGKTGKERADVSSWLEAVSPVDEPRVES
jgi:hypothetical protein